jgi:hypothetical protein
MLLGPFMLGFLAILVNNKNGGIILFLKFMTKIWTGEFKQLTKFNLQY